MGKCSPRSTRVGSLLLPVRDAAAFLAYEAHATVLGDHHRHRSGQRAGQPIGRAVPSSDVGGPLFGDLLAFEVQGSGHARDGWDLPEIMPPKPRSSFCLLMTTAPSAAARPAIRWAVSKSASSSVAISSSVVASNSCQPTTPGSCP